MTNEVACFLTAKRGDVSVDTKELLALCEEFLATKPGSQNELTKKTAIEHSLQLLALPNAREVMRERAYAFYDAAFMLKDRDAGLSQSSLNGLQKHIRRLTTYWPADILEFNTHVLEHSRDHGFILDREAIIGDVVDAAEKIADKKPEVALNGLKQVVQFPADSINEQYKTRIATVARSLFVRLNSGEAKNLAANVLQCLVPRASNGISGERLKALRSAPSHIQSGRYYPPVVRYKKLISPKS